MGIIKASRFQVRFRTCRGKRGYTGHEAIIGEMDKESKSAVVMAHDAIGTHRVREECMGTRPAQEVPANLLI